MQTDRERLIELIRQGKKEFTKSDETYIENYLADYLLANNVTIPIQCKDCKYRIRTNKHLLCGHQANFIYKTALQVNRFHWCKYGERKV